MSITFHEENGSQATFVGTLEGSPVEAEAVPMTVDQIDVPSDAPADGEMSFAHYIEDEAIATRVGTFGWPAGTDNGPATGATSGAPGTWSPSLCTVPTSTDCIAGTPNAVVASPATAWLTGEHVLGSDSQPVYWDGAAWVAGVAP